MITFTALAQDYHTLRENEVMNVSDMDLNTGVGADIADEGYIEQHEGMYYGDYTLIASDNLAAYLAAIQLIFGNEGFRIYALDIAEAAEFFEHALNRVPAFEGLFTDLPERGGSRIDPLTDYGAGAHANLIYESAPTRIPSPPMTPRGGSLAERLAELRPGYVLDVSDMDDAGKGVRQKLAPRTERSGRLGIPGIPIISNNSRSYILALQMVYGAEAPQQYAAELADIQAAHFGW